jgi:hypothetical protein
MPDEPILRAKAREVIRTGKLPNRRPDRTWGGPGVGASCTICGEPVTKDQLEFEIQFSPRWEQSWTRQVRPPHPLLRSMGVGAQHGRGHRIVRSVDLTSRDYGAKPL